MLNVKWIVVLTLAACLVCATGCSSRTRISTIDTGETGAGRITDSDPQPAWVTGRGRWVEEWDKENKDKADRYLWVVGTSQPVQSFKFEQAAEKSASDQAIFELIRALGITIDSLGMRNEAWSNETQDLVIGAYKEALQTQMARHKMNLENYEWYRYVVEDDGIGGTKQRSYLKKGLFRLDKQRLGESFANDTAEEFAKNVKERVRANAKVQKELVQRAKEATRKRMEELMGTADKK